VEAVVVNEACRHVEDVAAPAAAVDDDKYNNPTKHSQGTELTREGDATAGGKPRP
jgi:hypothetical protein